MSRHLFRKQARLWDLKEYDSKEKHKFGAFSMKKISLKRLSIMLKKEKERRLEGRAFENTPEWRNDVITIA